MLLFIALTFGLIYCSGNSVFHEDSRRTLKATNEYEYDYPAVDSPSNIAITVILSIVFAPLVILMGIAFIAIIIMSWIIILLLLFLKKWDT